ncbi:MAG: (2Fe-2S)-binding protein [Deltaproteobacteria bacterium]|nr:(2Fe-2S)-binding protein [Deltaproteobacteria bacterium]
MRVDFTLNSKPVSVLAGPTQTLLELLREDLGLLSLKNGCNTGDCGVCTVLLDGQAVRSCLTLVPTVEGRSVETLEALGGPGRLHPVQQAFLDSWATQCGYCTPGMILTVKAFLDHNPNPSREQITEALSGNLCRCTGYVKIIEAVERAARMMAGRDAHVG